MKRNTTQTGGESSTIRVDPVLEQVCSILGFPGVVQVLPVVSKSIRDVYKKKETIEDLKNQLLTEELEFKRKLYELQLQIATKDIEIKNAMLEQIKGT